MQVSYHPGWHATVAGRRCTVNSDALGLIWLAPECSGRCDISLDYDGGWELRLSRYISLAGWVALLALPLVRGRAVRYLRLGPTEAPGARIAI